LLLKIARDPPRPLGALAPDVHPGFVAIVQKAMARRRSERYRSAEEFRDAIRTWRNRIDRLLAEFLDLRHSARTGPLPEGPAQRERLISKIVIEPERINIRTPEPTTRELRRPALVLVEQPEEPAPGEEHPSQRMTLPEGAERKEASPPEEPVDAESTNGLAPFRGQRGMLLACAWAAVSIFGIAAVYVSWGGPAPLGAARSAAAWQAPAPRLPPPAPLPSASVSTPSLVMPAIDIVRVPMPSAKPATPRRPRRPD
jgi:hypothetical protein